MSPQAGRVTTTHAKYLHKCNTILRQGYYVMSIYANTKPWERCIVRGLWEPKLTAIISWEEKGGRIFAMLPHFSKRSHPIWNQVSLELRNIYESENNGLSNIPFTEASTVIVNLSPQRSFFNAYFSLSLKKILKSKFVLPLRFKTWKTVYAYL